jgi:hypothetical protein
MINVCTRIQQICTALLGFSLAICLHSYRDAAKKHTYLFLYTDTKEDLHVFKYAPYHKGVWASRITAPHILT